MKMGSADNSAISAFPEKGPTSIKTLTFIFSVTMRSCCLFVEETEILSVLKQEDDRRWRVSIQHRRVALFCWNSNGVESVYRWLYPMRGRYVWSCIVGLTCSNSSYRRVKSIIPIGYDIVGCTGNRIVKLGLFKVRDWTYTCNEFVEWGAVLGAVVWWICVWMCVHLR